MIFSLISRNLKLYFRDRTAVFFSLLSVFIVVGLFVLFLAKIQVDTIMESTINISEEKIAYLVHSWILAGLLSIITVTSVLGGFGTMVHDREKRIIMAFKSSPIKEWVYPFVNVVSAFIIGVMISTVALAVYTICIYFISGYVLPMTTLFSAFTMILYASLVNAFIGGCIFSFVKTSSAFSAISILIGTCIGFINGVYVSIGSISAMIVNVLAFFPSLHIATIFRKIVTAPAIKQVFAHAPESVLDQYLVDYGITLNVHGVAISTTTSMMYAGTIGIICLVMMILLIRKKNKEI